MHSGVSEPKRILREAKRKLDLPSSSSPQHSSATTISVDVNQGFFSYDLLDTQEERKSDLSVSIPKFEYFNPTQVDDFKVNSNPLSSGHKHIPEGTFTSDCFDSLKYFSLPYIPLTSRIFIDQLNVEVPSP